MYCRAKCFKYITWQRQVSLPILLLHSGRWTDSLHLTTKVSGREGSIAPIFRPPALRVTGRIFLMHPQR